MLIIKLWKSRNCSVFAMISKVDHRDVPQYIAQLWLMTYVNARTISTTQHNTSLSCSNITPLNDFRNYVHGVQNYWNWKQLGRKWGWKWLVFRRFQKTATVGAEVTSRGRRTIVVYVESLAACKDDDDGATTRIWASDKERLLPKRSRVGLRLRTFHWRSRIWLVGEDDVNVVQL